MRYNKLSRCVRSSRSLAEQSDAVNYHTFIEEYTKSGRLPSATGLPLGSFDYDSDDFDVDVDDSPGFQEDRADRYVKFREQLKMSRSTVDATPPADLTPPSDLTPPAELPQ